MKVIAILQLALIASTAIASNNTCEEQSKTGAIHELQQAGLLNIELHSNGEHQGASITMLVTNIGDFFITTTLEPGRTLIADNSIEQNLLVVEEVVIALHPQQTAEKQVIAFCYQSLNAGPKSGNAYQLGSLAIAPLFDIANYLNLHRNLEYGIQQSAIWVVSDCHPLSSVRINNEETQELSEFLAELLSIKRPWYTTEHVRTVDQLFTKQVARVSGNMPFEIDSYTVLSITIIDQNGRIVKRLLQDTQYGPGSYSHPVDLWVQNWPTGNYEVKLETSDRAIIGSYGFEL